MKRFAHTTAFLRDSLRRRKMFWRMLCVYLLGCIVLLGVFSIVLTSYLTKTARNNAIAQNQDTLTRAYATTDYILNTTYDSYYKLYQSSAVNDLMFSETFTAQKALAIDTIFSQAITYSDCVNSVYLLNKAQNKIYASDGSITGFEEFYDEQSLRLFQFYNEKSNTLFLPRITSFAIDGKNIQEYYFISLIFSQRNAVSAPMGGLIVNIDEQRLLEVITAQLESSQNMYIISENGSIMAAAEPDKINTSLYGSELWKELSDKNTESNFSFITDYNGTPCLVSGKSADKLRFWFLCITPVSQIETEANFIRNFILLCSCCFLGIAFLLSTLLSRFLYTPISQLVSFLHTRTNGDAELASPETAACKSTPAVDEMAFLGHTYNQLFGEIASLNHDNQLMESAQKREIVLSFLHGTYPTLEKCLCENARFSLFEEKGDFYVICILFDNYLKMSQELSLQDLQLYRYALKNIAEELFAEHFHAQCTEVGSDQLAVILQSTFSTDDTHTKISAILQHMNHVLTEHLACHISCGIGSCVNTLHKISKSYDSALTAISYRLVYGYNSVIFYEKIKLRQNVALEYPLETDTAIVQAIRNRSEEKALHLIEDFFQSIYRANIDTINMSITQLTISLSRAMPTLISAPAHSELPTYRLLSQQLADCDILEQRQNILQGYCKHLVQIRNSEMQSKKDTLIERVKEYIEQNYANPDLSTEDIALYAELSPNYLRTVFKAAIGISPTDFLTDYRIAQAQELLLSTNLSTKEVAAAVGYYNHRYFYSVFKTKTGLTASAFRSVNLNAPQTHEEESNETSNI